ncbi:MAG: GGDEF domain-containing protein [Proteobacteria bacterium]|nr:GGDEF domain-containing protein [Pseudomonadota bacterium]
MLDSMASAVLMIDMEGSSIFMNPEAKRLLKISESPDITQLLKEQLDDLARASAAESPGRTNLKIDGSGPEETIIQALYNTLDDGSILVSLRDISKEARLIQEYTLAKKELNAKHVLQEHREEKIGDLQARIQQMYKFGPHDFLIIDRHFDVKESNLEYRLPEGAPAIDKCYGMVGRDSPCDNCPITGDGVVEDQQRVAHTLAGKYIQETIAPFVDKRSFQLSFEDTTRKIVLIEEIREQHRTIQRQKDLFSDLVEVISFMHKSDDIAQVADCFLKMLLEKTESKSMALMVPGNQQNDFWIKSSLNIEKPVIDHFIEEYMALPVRSKTVGGLSLKRLPSPSDDWETIPLIDPKTEQIGFILLDSKLDDEKRQIVTLYCEPLTAHLVNTLLTQKLETIAHTDGLTGLYNRYYLMQAIEQEKSRYDKYASNFSAILGDVNGLKPINDKHGHEAGDGLLLAISECLKAVCRKTDIIARLGGDEFCVLLHDTASAGCELFIKRLNDYCQGRFFEISGAPPIPLSISLGFGSTDNDSANELIQKADEMMFKEKEKYYTTHDRYR